MSSAATLLSLVALGLICGGGAMLSVTVREGEEAVLPCPFGNFRNKTVVWTDQNKEVLTFGYRRIKPDMRLSTANNGTSWNLHLLNVTAEDQGLYTCRITTKPVRMKSVLLKLAGEEPPETFDIQAMNVSVDEGEKVTLPCSFEQASDITSAKVTWTNPKASLLAIETRTLIPDNRFSVAFTPPATWDLTLTSAKPSDSGVYTCRLNTATLSMRTITLTVKAMEKETDPAGMGPGGADTGEAGQGQGEAMEDGPKKVTAEAGKTAFLPCMHSASHTNLVVWRKNGTMLTIGRRRMSPERRMHVRRPNTRTWTLRIRPVKSSDAGLYECVDNENKKTKTVTLVVTNPPTFLNKDFQEVLTVIEGDDVTIDCSATGVPEPKVTWYKKFGQEEPEELPDTEGRLTLYGVTRNLSQTSFTCKVDNGVRKPLTRQATLQVMYPPEVTVPAGPVQMKTGSRLSLICDVMAPQGAEVKVTWYRLPGGEDSEEGKVDSDSLSLDHGFALFEFHPAPGHERLVLEKNGLEEGDFAVYRCHASNGQGQSQAHVQIVELRVHPVINMTAIKGEQAVLPCATDDLSTDMQVRWKRDEEVLALNDKVTAFEPRYSISTPSPGQWNLVISDVRPSDRGDYQCWVESAAKEEYTISLEVDVPTRLTSPPIDATVRQGDDITLQCEAEGDPEPEITWYRYTSQGREEATELVRTDGGYMLSDAEKEHSGIYECVADNDVHPAAAGKASLTVMFTPEVSIVEDDMTVARGDDVAMTCVVAAMPRVSGVWIKDGGQIEASRRRGIELLTEEMDGFTTRVTLRLTADSDRDFGNYLCMATNAMGQGQDQLRLIEKEDSGSDGTDQKKKKRKKNKKKYRNGEEEPEEDTPTPEPEAESEEEDTTPYIPPTQQGDQGGAAGQSVSGKDNGAGLLAPVSMVTVLAVLAARLTQAALLIPSLT